MSRIKADESLSDQALLIFEAQVDFIVRLKDILIDELINKMGWIQRSKDGNRQKIENRTNNFSEADITHHHTTAQVLLDLCRGERKWEFLTEEERKKLTKNKLIQTLREPKQCLKAVLTEKLISYIREGKITFAHSFKYQDIGKVIESIELSDTDWMVTRGDIEKLIGGTYPINFESESFQTPAIEGRENDTNYPFLIKYHFNKSRSRYRI